MADFDIVVIGAGLSGIAFARFYLEIHPETRMVLLEADHCVGGVWSASRSFPTFWSQSGARMTGFSDVSLEAGIPTSAPRYWDFFEAKHVTAYLEDYVSSHVYAGASLRSRIRFGHQVTHVSRGTAPGLSDSTTFWTVHIRVKNEDASDGGTRSITATKIVAASGLTSVPHMPGLPGREVYTGVVCHHRDFGQISAAIEHGKLGDVQNIAVLGGGKSAADMVYDMIKKGKRVSWIIRKDGEGPAYLFVPGSSAPYRNSVEKAATRITATMASPSSFMELSWISSLWHKSTYGIKSMREMREHGAQACRNHAGYYRRPGALPDFKKLDFTTSPFWLTGPVGMAQHKDFWDLTAQNAYVYRNNIVSMKQRTIVLDNGSEITADILFCGTGWESAYSFLSPEDNALLGLPHSPDDDSREESERWKKLLQIADQRVLREHPQLAHPPEYKEPRTSTTTARLYNCIAPLQNSSIIFLGRALLSNSFRTAEAQAIWATAFLDGSFKIPPLDQARKEVAYMNAFSKRRYPSHGAAGDCIFFELVSYTDKLMRDIGLTSHRKGWFWCSDLWEPCLASDFKDIPAEYRRKFGF